MSTELEQRLRRLAADVDLDQGRAEQRARQARAARLAGRRRVLVGAGAAAVVAVVAATGWVLHDGSGDDGEGDVIANGGPPSQTTSAALDGVEVTVTAPTDVEAGGRLWFDAVVRNQGEPTVYWEAGGCGIPVEASVGPSSRPVDDPPRPIDEVPRWDGDVDGLGSWLAEHNTLSPRQDHQPADMTARRAIGCTRDSRSAPLEPGGQLRHRGSIEVRVPPGGLGDGGRYQLIVAFQPYSDTIGFGEELPPVEVRVPVTVTDDPRRSADSSDAAIDAFAADPRLAGWIASTDVPGRPDLVQDFGTELSWWRGAWELWVDAHWDDHRLLRMRYDPAGGDVVDVRTVSMAQAPEDEPGRSTVGDLEPDEIL